MHVLSDDPVIITHLFWQKWAQFIFNILRCSLQEESEDTILWGSYQHTDFGSWADRNSWKVRKFAEKYCCY